MLIISTRRNFSNADYFSEQTYAVSHIDLQSDTVIAENISADQFVETIKGKRVLLLVHGYNTEQDEVYDAYAVIERSIKRHLEDTYDLILGYLWPGGDQAWEWKQAKSRANGAGRRLRYHLESLPSEAIDVMSHSLGGRVVLKALKYSGKKELIRNYYCTAAAVDDECLEPGEEFFRAIESWKRVFVFHSKYDKVLATAYIMAEFDSALGLRGPEDKDYIQNRAHSVHIINCKHKIRNHGGYKNLAEMYQFIDQYLTEAPPKIVTF
ncbi:MAG: alpha/beta hydrolase [Cyanophyceae cyanobacterium]